MGYLYLLNQNKKTEQKNKNKNKTETQVKIERRLTSIPACRKTLCTGKNNRYFDFKYLKISAYLNTSYIFYKLYSMATSGYLKALLLENHVHIVAFTPDLQRVSFYSVTEFLYHSFTTELILSLILYKGVLFELQGLTTMQEIVISLVAAVAY